MDIPFTVSSMKLLSTKSCLRLILKICMAQESRLLPDALLDPSLRSSDLFLNLHCFHLSSSLLRPFVWDRLSITFVADIHLYSMHISICLLEWTQVRANSLTGARLTRRGWLRQEVACPFHPRKCKSKRPFGWSCDQSLGLCWARRSGSYLLHSRPCQVHQLRGHGKQNDHLYWVSLPAHILALHLFIFIVMKSSL